MQTAIIFDIDGTLIDSEHIDSRYFIRALRDIVGDIHIVDDWSNYTKVTDVGIVSEILERNGITATTKIVETIREHFRTLLQQFFNQGGTCVLIPGITKFLHILQTNPALTLGIATGGWGKTALMKLDSARINIDSIPLSSSDDGDNRTVIMQHCLDKMNGPFDRIVYIGDGIWDRDACQELGWMFIGIGEKLRGKCEIWFEDFRDIDALLQVIK